LYAFSGAGDLHFGSTNMLKGGKVETFGKSFGHVWTTESSTFASLQAHA